MNATTINPDVKNYWFMLKDLSNEVKLELISRLSSSLLRKEESETLSASRFYGTWTDEDAMEANLLNDEIRKSRSFKDDIQAF